MKVLLDAGAKVDAKCGSHQQQPIHKAAWAGHFGTVELLLARGADPNAENTHGARPLYFASLEKFSEHQKTARVLEAAGATLVETGRPSGSGPESGRSPVSTSVPNPASPRSIYRHLPEGRFLLNG